MPLVRFLPHGLLARTGDVLRNIPGVIVHGQLDLGALAGAPWVLHNAWPGSELVIVEHGTHATGTTEALIAATDHFAGTPAESSS